MPCFHFHLAAPGFFSEDEDGSDFDSLDEAYLDACRAAMEMSFEMLRSQQSPNRFSFIIVNGTGDLLLTVPFSEVLRSAGGRSLRERMPVIGAIELEIERARALKQEFAAQMVRLRESIAISQQVVRRSRDLS